MHVARKHKSGNEKGMGNVQLGKGQFGIEKLLLFSSLPSVEAQHFRVNQKNIR